MYNEKGLKIVREDFCCVHWEPDEEALVPMKECWCCKWSNFRTESKNSPSENLSVCDYASDEQAAVNK